ncbi:hypothetical protein [Desulfomonile tiedjei]|uniref:Uncharacterized protein n=1 Tax=Desulfomonile tiedjei (strain ATCC 49306 / DSM 6799 / DCB-1) TaxID=706587 RepID=I4C174_DESTA|nr:hypothetical protein [Desulfomonile tiedjei]AFM23315.1 hypothetical protein Desti_0584 [Desulfomonile tiedjei DSM 6799]
MKASSAFREDELVCRRQKINGEWVENYFPRVGGRLRLAHEQNEQLGIQTDVIRFEESLAVVKATVATNKGSFCGFGTASAQRDARLADSLLELAETRSIARALRFSGFGMEFTSAEEISHTVQEAERNGAENDGKHHNRVFEHEEGQNKPESKSTVPPKSNGNGSGGTITQAQCRALYALTKKAHYTQADIDGMLSSMGAKSFEDLTRETASRLISSIQTEIAA